MYLSKKDRSAESTSHALAQRYEQEHRNTLSKVRNITHEVELVARMVKVSWNTNADDKQLALEKLVGILDTLNSLRHQQREVLKRPEDTKQRGNNRRNGENLRRPVGSAHVSIDALSASPTNTHKQ